MFNPHPRMEGDDMSCQGQTDVSLFQSTPSHGGRRKLGLCIMKVQASFNPRPHMKGDWKCGKKVFGPYSVSIHALT